jgi:hypothetical protein
MTTGICGQIFKPPVLYVWARCTKDRGHEGEHLGETVKIGETTRVHMPERLRKLKKRYARSKRTP